MTNTVLLALLKKLEGKVDSLETIGFEHVTELPETGEPNIIYLVPKSDPETGNYSDEYIWDSDNQTYEKIGDTMVSPLPEVSAADNGKLLGVENGEWGKVDKPIKLFNAKYRSNNEPESALDLLNGAKNSDLYNSFIGGYEVAIAIYDYYDNLVGYAFAKAKSGINPNCVIISLVHTSGQVIGEHYYMGAGQTLAELKYFGSSPILKTNVISASKKDRFLKTMPGSEPGVMLTSNPNYNVADAYSSSSTYDLGDLVIYNDKLYECTTAITVAENWTAAHWTAKTVADELASKANNSDIPADANHNIASAYDSTATYAVGDLCIYDGNLYECSTAISTAEEWTAAHWTQKTVAQELAGAGGASYVELGGKLLAGNNTLTFNDECITVGSIFEFYTDAYGVNPTDVSVTDGTLVLTFDIQQDNLKVKVRVWEDENPIVENI